MTALYKRAPWGGLLPGVNREYTLQSKLLSFYAARLGGQATMEYISSFSLATWLGFLSLPLFSLHFYMFMSVRVCIAI